MWDYKNDPNKNTRISSDVSDTSGGSRIPTTPSSGRSLAGITTSRGDETTLANGNPSVEVITLRNIKNQMVAEGGAAYPSSFSSPEGNDLAASLSALQQQSLGSLFLSCLGKL